MLKDDAMMGAYYKVTVGVAAETFMMEVAWPAMPFFLDDAYRFAHDILKMEGDPYGMAKWLAQDLSRFAGEFVRKLNDRTIYYDVGVKFNYVEPAWTPNFEPIKEVPTALAPPVSYIIIGLTMRGGQYSLAVQMLVGYMKQILDMLDTTFEWCVDDGYAEQFMKHHGLKFIDHKRVLPWIRSMRELLESDPGPQDKVIPARLPLGMELIAMAENIDIF